MYISTKVVVHHSDEVNEMLKTLSDYKAEKYSFLSTFTTSSLICILLRFSPNLDMVPSNLPSVFPQSFIFKVVFYRSQKNGFWGTEIGCYKKSKFQKRDL